MERSIHTTSESKGDQWSNAKERVGLHLLEKSKPDYSQNPEVTGAYQAVNDHYIAGDDIGPTDKWHRELHKLNNELRHVKRECAKTRRGAYLASLRKEVLKKSFFHHYKHPRSSTQIPEVYITPDWDHPDTKSAYVDYDKQDIHNKTKSSPEGVLEEFTDYYSWLFQEKPSISPERHLALL